MRRMSDRDPWVPAFTLEELPVGEARVFARERSLARQVHAAIGFVVHGKVPRTLT